MHCSELNNRLLHSSPSCCIRFNRSVPMTISYGKFSGLVYSSTTNSHFFFLDADISGNGSPPVLFYWQKRPPSICLILDGLFHSASMFQPLPLCKCLQDSTPDAACVYVRINLYSYPYLFFKINDNTTTIFGMLLGGLLGLDFVLPVVSCYHALKEVSTLSPPQSASTIECGCSDDALCGMVCKISDLDIQGSFGWLGISCNNDCLQYVIPLAVVRARYFISWWAAL